ncbi:hypothetical protein MKX08_002081 [Trichoderma sp. CBMAI-0020]|nr:hypothetical protein MKX08_002081 [Trichoderma sp. CBMAI-0020]
MRVSERERVAGASDPTPQVSLLFSQGTARTARVSGRQEEEEEEEEVEEEDRAAFCLPASAIRRHRASLCLLSFAYMDCTDAAGETAWISAARGLVCRGPDDIVIRLGGAACQQSRLRDQAGCTALAVWCIGPPVQSSTTTANSQANASRTYWSSMPAAKHPPRMARPTGEKASARG